MIIDKSLEFPASGDVIDLKAGGNAIGQELWFHVIGSGAYTLTTGPDTSAAGKTLLSGTSDGEAHVRVPLGLDRYIKATFTGKAFIAYAPQFSYENL